MFVHDEGAGSPSSDPHHLTLCSVSFGICNQENTVNCSRQSKTKCSVNSVIFCVKSFRKKRKLERKFVSVDKAIQSRLVWSFIFNLFVVDDKTW